MKTSECLIKAILEECTSEDKYRAYSRRAEKEQYYQMAAIFKDIADQEGQHAERFRKLLNNQEAKVLAYYSDYKYSDETVKNLLFSKELEINTINDYRHFEAICRANGDTLVANAFKEIAEVEEFHEKTFSKLRQNILEDKVYTRGKIMAWHCRNCGYVHWGYSAPMPVCPACKETYRYYELLAENY